MFSKSETELPIRYLQSKFCAPRRTRSSSITSCNAHLSRNISAIVMPVLEGQGSIPSNLSETYYLLQNYEQSTRNKEHTPCIISHKHLRACISSILEAFLSARVSKYSAHALTLLVPGRWKQGHPNRPSSDSDLSLHQLV